jgi:ankyrin repeat protein
MPGQSSQSEQVDSVRALHNAWANDDSTRVESLLRDFAMLRALLEEPLPGSSFDSLPIHDAVRRGNLAMVDVLLRAGVDINARTRWWAGGFGVLDLRPELSASLIERGAVVDAHAAARLGMLDRLRELIEADPDIVMHRGGDGQTPLHVAASLEIAKMLVEHGAEIDALDVDHESTPAQYLVRDRQDIVRFLMSRGCRTDILMAAAVGDVERVRMHLDANPESIDTTVSETWFPMRDPRAGGTIYQWTLGSHRTPHAVAREFGRDDVLALLMARSSDGLRLAEACASGDSAAVDALLARQPDIARSLSPRDQRKVADAARDNDTATVRLMLSAGWPASVRGHERGTPLHWAGWHGNVELVTEVLRHNPELDASDNAWGSNPLSWAIYASKHGWHPGKGNYPATVQALIDAGSRTSESIENIEASDDVLAVLRRNAERAPI